MDTIDRIVACEFNNIVRRWEKMWKDTQNLSVLKLLRPPSEAMVFGSSNPIHLRHVTSAHSGAAAEPGNLCWQTGICN